MEFKVNGWETNNIGVTIIDNSIEFKNTAVSTYNHTPFLYIYAEIVLKGIKQLHLKFLKENNITYTVFDNIIDNSDYKINFENASDLIFFKLKFL